MFQSFFLSIRRDHYLCFRIIPHICQFWYTAALFRPVKVHQKVRKFAKVKVAKIGLCSEYTIFIKPRSNYCFALSLTQWQNQYIRFNLDISFQCRNSQQVIKVYFANILRLCDDETEARTNVVVVEEKYSIKLRYSTPESFRHLAML